MKRLLLVGILVCSVGIHSSPCVGKDLLLEFKTAYFLSTSSVFKNIYGNGGALYGPEITFKMYRGLYGWASFDFLTKSGTSSCSGASTCDSVSSCDQLSVCSGDCTKLFLMPIGLGLKYFVPFANSTGRFTGDFYVGLGVEPTYLQTKDSSPYVYRNHSKWGVGGIAKVGAYFNLPRNFFIDVFVDYSFDWVKNKSCAAPEGVVVPTTANVSGAIFGAGIGYRFN